MFSEIWGLDENNKSGDKELKYCTYILYKIFI